MAKSLINPPNDDVVLANRRSSKQTQHALFSLGNGTIRSGDDASDDDDGIEMIEFQSDNYYTSLKDLLPSVSPPSAASPTAASGGSWKEIPIRDPLLKHAAWAYLQPMSSAYGEEDGGAMWWVSVEKGFCGLFKCFNDVVLLLFKSLFFSGKKGG